MRIHAEEVEGVAEYYLPGGDGVEVVEDLVGDLRVDVKKSRCWKGVRDRCQAHAGEGMGDGDAREEVGVDVVADLEGEG